MIIILKVQRIKGGCCREAIYKINNENEKFCRQEKKKEQSENIQTKVYNEGWVGEESV